MPTSPHLELVGISSQSNQFRLRFSGHTTCFRARPASDAQQSIRSGEVRLGRIAERTDIVDKEDDQKAAKTLNKNIKADTVLLAMRDLFGDFAINKASGELYIALGPPGSAPVQD